MRKTSAENPILARSRAALIGAAARLLDERDAAEISVKDAVADAGMSRPTFYQHFGDLGTLFSAAGLDRLAAMFADLDPVHADDLFGAAQSLIERMQQHARFYKRVQESPGGAAFHAGAVQSTAAWLRAQPALSRLRDADAATVEFIAAGVVWTVTRHLVAYCHDPEDPRLQPAADLARILSSLERADTHS